MKSFWRLGSEWLDRTAIRMACPTVNVLSLDAETHRRAGELIRDPAYLWPAVPPASVILRDGREFEFESPLPGPWPENNRVLGRWRGTRKEWQTKPAVILLHGWNGEHTYEGLFPWLIPRLAAKGLNAFAPELPFHRQRKPRAPGAVTNLLTNNALQNLEATRQALAETQALASWAKAQGCPKVAVWGHSLGAYLGGVAICGYDTMDAAVMMAPVSRMDEVIANLDFCAPLRQSLQTHPVELAPLNLKNMAPRVARANILLVEGAYDLFVTPASVRELAEAWGGAQHWRLKQGHLTILLSLLKMERIIRWLAERLR